MSTLGGIAYPFRFGSHGGVSLATSSDKVKANLESLAKTAVNERVIRKKVGTVGYSQVLRNQGESSSIGVIRDLVREALARYEPRAVILRVAVRGGETRDGSATYVDVDYIFRETGERDTVQIQIS